MIYPNPCDGSQPAHLAFKLDSSTDGVKIQLFTTAFRKVLDKALGSLPAGTHLSVFELKDNGGAPLASGVYYVVITAGSQRSVVKLLVLR